MTAPHPLLHPPRLVPPESQRLRPWPDLPSETQTQIARLLGDLLRRMAPDSRAVMEISRAERREQR